MRKKKEPISALIAISQICRLAVDFYIHTFSPTFLPDRESTQSEVGRKSHRPTSEISFFSPALCQPTLGPHNCVVPEERLPLFYARQYTLVSPKGRLSRKGEEESTARKKKRLPSRQIAFLAAVTFSLHFFLKKWAPLRRREIISPTQKRNEESLFQREQRLQSPRRAFSEAQMGQRDI